MNKFLKNVYLTIPVLFIGLISKYHTSFPLALVFLGLVVFNFFAFFKARGTDEEEELKKLNVLDKINELPTLQKIKDKENAYNLRQIEEKIKDLDSLEQERKIKITQLNEKAKAYERKITF